MAVVAIGRHGFDGQNRPIVAEKHDIERRWGIVHPEAWDGRRREDKQHPVVVGEGVACHQATVTQGRRGHDVQLHGYATARQCPLRARCRYCRCGGWGSAIRKQRPSNQQDTYAMHVRDSYRDRDTDRDWGMLDSPGHNLQV